MPRRCSSGDSSLELLLDTICNTFGGVLFLAILVSLMLAQTRRKTDASPAAPAAAVSAADLVRLETRVQDATRELEALEARAAQARRAAGDLAVPNAEALLGAMEEAEARARAAESRRTALLATLAAEQAAEARAAAAKAADERDRQRLAEEAEQARRRLAKAVEDREELLASAIRIRDDAAHRATVNTTGKAPQMRSTTRREFALLLRYGRLYLTKTMENGELVVNRADFTVKPWIDSNLAEAKPHAGVDLAVVEGRDAALRRVTADFPPSQWYACLVVHPDSFEEYLIVKNWLVQRGYECRLFPTNRGVYDQGVGDVDVQ